MVKILTGKLKAASLIAVVFLLVIFAASANSENSTLKQAFLPKVVEVTTRTPAAVSNTIKTKVSTVAEYERNIYLGLKNQEDKIQFNIVGYDKEKFNFESSEIGVSENK